ncbi:MAG: LamG domain-containing protein [Phycisphaerae bacterium]|nr:LamG domain-containing protein [Phycisphaerae bacterium]
MTRKCRLLIGAVSVLLVFVATCACWAAEDKALVLDFRFDEGKGKVAHDVSGLENHGKIKGAKWVALAKGHALKFDGAASQVEVPANPSLNIGTSPFSVEVWLRPDDLSGAADVISKWGKNEFMLRVGARGGRAIFFMTDWNSYRMSNPKAVKVGKWTHMVVVKQHDEKGGIDVRCYVNGEDQTGSIGGKPFPAEIKGSKNNLYIGGLVGYGYFKGLIAGVRIYKKALTAEEVRAHAREISPEDLSVQ